MGTGIRKSPRCPGGPQGPAVLVRRCAHNPRSHNKLDVVAEPPTPRPWPYLRTFMGATLSQAPALVLYLSTELRQLVPSLPPATYRAPSRTATPAELRRLSMEATGVHEFTCRDKRTG